MKQKHIKNCKVLNQVPNDKLTISFSELPLHLFNKKDSAISHLKPNSVNSNEIWCWFWAGSMQVIKSTIFRKSLSSLVKHQYHMQIVKHQYQMQNASGRHGEL